MGYAGKVEAAAAAAVAAYPHGPRSFDSGSGAHNSADLGSGTNAAAAGERWGHAPVTSGGGDKSRGGTPEPALRPKSAGRSKSRRASGTQPRVQWAVPGSPERARPGAASPDDCGTLGSAAAGVGDAGRPAVGAMRDASLRTPGNGAAGPAPGHGAAKVDSASAPQGHASLSFRLLKASAALPPGAIGSFDASSPPAGAGGPRPAHVRTSAPHAAHAVHNAQQAGSPASGAHNSEGGTSSPSCSSPMVEVRAGWWWWWC